MYWVLLSRRVSHFTRSNNHIRSILINILVIMCFIIGHNPIIIFLCLTPLRVNFDMLFYFFINFKRHLHLFLIKFLVLLPTISILQISGTSTILPPCIPLPLWFLLLRLSWHCIIPRSKLQLALGHLCQSCWLCFLNMQLGYSHWIVLFNVGLLFGLHGGFKVFRWFIRFGGYLVRCCFWKEEKVRDGGKEN